MAVVLIMAVTVALAAPAIGGAMGEQRASATTLELIGLGRRARAQSAAYGRAHLIRWDASDNGSFRAYRGIVSDCNANDWPVLIDAGECGTVTSMCVAELVPPDGTDGTTDVRITSVEANAAIDICYEPSGVMKWRTGTTGRLSPSNTISGGFRFAVQRYEGGSAIGPTRTLLIPLGGDVRSVR
jgi:type II secretory pathway pseudopilin PulG